MFPKFSSNLNWLCYGVNATTIRGYFKDTSGNMYPFSKQENMYYRKVISIKRRVIYNKKNNRKNVIIQIKVLKCIF
jgi:hypothetical protein